MLYNDASLIMDACMLLLSLRRLHSLLLYDPRSNSVTAVPATAVNLRLVLMPPREDRQLLACKFYLSLHIGERMVSITSR